MWKIFELVAGTISPSEVSGKSALWRGWNDATPSIINEKAASGSHEWRLWMNLAPIGGGEKTTANEPR
jgi:hypothetical protein